MSVPQQRPQMRLPCLSPSSDLRWGYRVSPLSGDLRGGHRISPRSPRGDLRRGHRVCTPAGTSDALGQGSSCPLCTCSGAGAGRTPPGTRWGSRERSPRPPRRPDTRGACGTRPHPPGRNRRAEKCTEQDAALGETGGAPGEKAQRRGRTLTAARWSRKCGETSVHYTAGGLSGHAPTTPPGRVPGEGGGSSLNHAPSVILASDPPEGGGSRDWTQSRSRGRGELASLCSPIGGRISPRPSLMLLQSRYPLASFSAPGRLRTGSGSVDRAAGRGGCCPSPGPSAFPRGPRRGPAPRLLDGRGWVKGRAQPGWRPLGRGGAGRGAPRPPGRWGPAEPRLREGRVRGLQAGFGGSQRGAAARSLRPAGRRGLRQAPVAVGASAHDRGHRRGPVPEP